MHLYFDNTCWPFSQANWLPPSTLRAKTKYQKHVNNQFKAGKDMKTTVTAIIALNYCVINILLTAVTVKRANS